MKINNIDLALNNNSFKEVQKNNSFLIERLRQACELPLTSSLKATIDQVIIDLECREKIHAKAACLSEKVNVGFLDFLINPFIGSGYLWSDVFKDRKEKICEISKRPDWLVKLIEFKYDIFSNPTTPLNVKTVVMELIISEHEKWARLNDLLYHPIAILLKEFEEKVSKNKIGKGGRPRIIQKAFFSNVLRAHFEDSQAERFQPVIAGYLKVLFPDYVAKKIKDRKSLTDSEIAKNITQNSKAIFKEHGFYAKTFHIYKNRAFGQVV